MEKIWYYAIQGDRQGPVTFDTLRQLVADGQLSDLDLVWQPDFGPEWRNAGQVRELFQSASKERLLGSERDIKDNFQITGVRGLRPSATGAVSQAFNRMVMLLFRPFDLTRWCSIGFCAWLAYLGSHNSVNFPQTKEFKAIHFKQQFDLFLDKLVQWPENQSDLLLVVSVTLVLVLVWLWLCSLRSRGDFMFLHRWYEPDAPIVTCWRASRAAGHALFAWRVTFVLIIALLYSLIASYTYGMIIKPYLATGKVWNHAFLIPIVGCLTVSILVGMVAQLTAHLAKAFIVPLVYWNGITIARAWRVVFDLVNQYPFAVFGYFNYGILSAMLAGVAIITFGLFTCCIGFIPLVLPYVSAVVLLPYTFFFRGYSLCFLNQWRPELVPDEAGPRS